MTVDVIEIGRFAEGCRRAVWVPPPRIVALSSRTHEEKVVTPNKLMGQTPSPPPQVDLRPPWGSVGTLE